MISLPRCAWCVTPVEPADAVSVLDLTPDVATQVDAERCATALYGVGVWCWRADRVPKRHVLRACQREHGADAAGGITTERAR